MTEDSPYNHQQNNQDEMLETIGSPEPAGIEEGEFRAPVQIDEETSVGDQTNDPDAGRIKDKELAVDVAYAGKPDRDTALSYKKKAEEVRSVFRDVSKLASADESLDGDEKAANQREIKDKIDVLGLGGYTGSRLKTLVDRVNESGTNLDELKGEAEFRIEDAAEGYDEEAKYYDGRADRLEYWTEVIGTHPLSEAFLTQHQVNADYLAGVEEDLHELEEQLADLEENLEGLEEWPLAAVTGNRSRALPTIQQIVGEAYLDEPDKTEIYASTDEVLKDPNTTLSKICKIYRKAFQKARIEPLQVAISMKQDILEDVRSGRASDPNYSKK